MWTCEAKISQDVERRRDTGPSCGWAIMLAMTSRRDRAQLRHQECAQVLAPFTLMAGRLTPNPQRTRTSQRRPHAGPCGTEQSAGSQRWAGSRPCATGPAPGLRRRRAMHTARNHSVDGPASDAESVVIAATPSWSLHRMARQANGSRLLSLAGILLRSCGSCSPRRSQAATPRTCALAASAPGRTSATGTNRLRCPTVHPGRAETLEWLQRK